MSSWQGILKDVKQISSTGIRTKLGTTPLTMGDDDDDVDCCRKAHLDMLNLMDSIYNHHTLSQLFRNGAYVAIEDLQELILDEDGCAELDKLIEDYWQYFWDIQSHFRMKNNSQEYRDATTILDDIDEIRLEWDLCDD